jgi:Transposase DDE domain
MKQYRPWTKLTIVCHNSTHLIAAADVRVGPCNDSPAFGPTVGEAVERLPIDRLLGDGGYDSEGNHQRCRELGIRSSVIPVNNRGRDPQAITGKYRRQMLRRFPRRIYGRRWQVESVISRFKRVLGCELTARTAAGRERECYCRVITHDLSILRLAG